MSPDREDLLAMSFHVFLSHSSADKPAVEELARRLAREGIQAWLDKWNLIPGDPWQPAIEKALAESETCAVFVGPSGLGPWQNEEMRAAIDQRVCERARRFRVIPVLLPGAERAERSSLPTFLAATSWVEFRDSLDDADAFHRLVCGIRGLEPGPGPGQAFYEGQCPYKGLRVFDVTDAAFFFGREALVQWLLNQVRPATEGQPVNRFLAIVGASGSGKSSVARAGLVAALKHDAIPGSSRWPVAILRPGPDPVESLAVALSRVLNIAQSVPALAELIEAFQRNDKTLHLVARQSLPENPLGTRLVILVDQFEEIFTLFPREELRDALKRNLLYAAKVAQGQTLVILTMRADFYPKCAADAELAAAFSDHHILVGPMTEDELHLAIERPAKLVGCELESGLVDLLVRDVRLQAGALPLLQHALLELWERREGRRLTSAAYKAIGRIEGALERRANALLKDLTEPEREICRRIFLRLIQPGEGTEDTKRRAALCEVFSCAGESSAVEAVVQKLANARLITTEGEPPLKTDVLVEVAHEALIRGWSQLRKWIDADRAGLRTHRRLTEAATEWQNNNNDSSYFYRGLRLAVAKEWAEAHPTDLNPLERKFLDDSIEIERERQAAEQEAAQRFAAEQQVRQETDAYEIARNRAIERYTSLSTEEILNIYRQTHRASAEEVQNDWHTAELHFACAVLHGRIDLRQIPRDSYWRLEGIGGRMWLREVKRLNAYFRWQRRGGGFGQPEADSDSDYLDTCNELEEALKDAQRKLGRLAFEPIEQHLREHFLNKEGHLDTGNERVRLWIAEKAARHSLESWSPQQNWASARAFMKLYYENITRAVLTGDPSATTSGVKALGMCGTQPIYDAMINCFEMIVAVQFLPVEVLLKLGSTCSITGEGEYKKA